MTKVNRSAQTDRQYWLLKSEPRSFPFDDLWNAPGHTTHWDGVRNYQARNCLREMKKGDLAFFYHSGAEPGIVGIVEIVREAYPDHTAVDPKDPHYDPNTKPGEESPWSMVDVHAVERFPRSISLGELRTKPELEGMPLLQKGNRLSVQKVGAAEWNAVVALAKLAPG
ncbi:MAG: EVE domain-containing protein [Gemmatimonadota bacterium]|nr:EVE domain-containing protein [Gemmatimonadota bacterium]